MLTEMLKKLDEKRLIRYEKYGGITLTVEGSPFIPIILELAIYQDACII